MLVEMFETIGHLPNGGTIHSIRYALEEMNGYIDALETAAVRGSGFTVETAQGATFLPTRIFQRTVFQIRRSTVEVSDEQLGTTS